MKARFHPNTAPTIAFLLACFLAHTKCFGATNLRITQALYSQTVPLGSPVQLAVKFETPLIATKQWFHDGIAIRNATNETYALASITAEDIGTYSIVIRTASQQVTNSAVVDIAAPYPDVRIEEVSDLSFSAPKWLTLYSGIGQMAVLPSGNIAQAPIGYFWPFDASQQFECWSPPDTLLWRSQIDTADTTPLQIPATLDSSPNGNIRIGVPIVTTRTSVLGTNIDVTVVRWVQVEVTEAGRLIYFSTNNAFHGTDFMSNGDGTVTVNSNDGEMLAFSNEGALLNRIRAVTKAAIYGRAFYILGSVAPMTAFPEFNFVSRSGTATIYGKYNSKLEPAWMTEVELGGRTNIGWYSWPPFLRTTVETPDDGILATLPAVNQTYTNNHGQSVAKIVRGKIGWEVRFEPFETIPIVNKPIDLTTTPLGTIYCRGEIVSPDGTITIGDRKMGPFGRPFRYAAIIDQGGFLRNIMVDPPPLNFEKRPLRIAPSRFYCFQKDTNTPRTLRVKVYIPEPDLAEPPAPERIMSVQNGEAVTLSASPDVPGVCVYRWFKDGREINGSRGHDLEISSFAIGNAGQYSVKIRNAYGTVTNRIATLSYTGPPQLAAELRNSTATISWPLSITGFHLQQAQTLGTDFTDVTFAPSVTNEPAGTVEFSVPLNSNQSFFRFVKRE